ncbi:hypothetical protein Dsin_028885 [Dipteronia sinensis]|uniref:Reverse transcriptase n=1 Tax=Dipteronia sinensis TaxID=43782 RepID=A0AAE0DV08_9ROSI|nr:hypothetical protein Dsin_028885 [Dipteronia sinensis]
MVADYLGNLFRLENTQRDYVSQVLDCMEARLSHRSSAYLDAIFTAEKVCKTVFDMALSKAPRPDGLPAGFYQNFWSTVGKNVTEGCLKCLQSGETVAYVNDTLVCLIPKVKKTIRMSEFRPISLCNVIYKIVATTLTNRLRNVIGEVTSEVHITFIPRRLITNTAIVGFECLHS